MKKIVCEMCGSNDLLKKDNVFVCQSCGTKYSVEEAKKMMVEGKVDVSGSKVKIDDADKIKNYFMMANNAYDADNKKEAEKYSNKILEIEPNNYEAWFLKGKAAGWLSTVAKPRFEEALECFSKTVTNAPEKEKERFKDEISNEIKNLCSAYLESLGNRFINNPSLSNLNDLVDGAQYNIKIAMNLIKKCDLIPIDLQQERALIIYNAVTQGQQNIYRSDYVASKYYLKELEENYRLEHAIMSVIEYCIEDFSEENKLGAYKYLVSFCSLLKGYLDIHSKTTTNLSLNNKSYSSSLDVNQEKQELINKYNEYLAKIKAIEPNYVPEVPMNSGGCYVATCVYGSYDCPEVWTLRRFRDYKLAKTWYGRLFIHSYYTISPTIVKLFGKTKWFKKVWKGKLDKLVNRLQNEGIEDTPYVDKDWK